MSATRSADWPANPLSLSTTDVDEARIAVSTYFYPTFLDVLGARQLAASFDVVRSGPLTIGDVRCGADVSMRFGELGAYHVDLPVSGRLWWRQGRRTASVATPERAAVFLPVGDTALEHWPAECRLLAVKIDRRALEQQLELLLDAPVRSPVPLDPDVDLTSVAGRSWAGLVRLLAAEYGATGGLLRHPGTAEHLQQSLISGLLVLASAQYRESFVAPVRRCGPRTVKRAVDAMHSRPAYPFTMAKLAEIAGVSARTLQEGFRRHVGTPPMTYLRDLRLVNAHRDLSGSGTGPVSVADIAHRSGFTHLGRFAAAYRARYGVSPSQTLRD